MGRYLPRDYDPIPDAYLRSGADLTDLTRRIARNQNWIWASQGAVLAAFGQEPMTTQLPVAVGESWVPCAIFAAPNVSATGNATVEVHAHVSVSGDLSTVNAQLALYQLLPGESGVTASSPLDVSPTITVAGHVSFTARVRSGADPLRFALYISGHGTATYALESATVFWSDYPYTIQGETYENWMAMSQGFVTANRAASAAMLRAISGRTLGLLAQNRRPIFSHSFGWPRVINRSASGEVAKWTIKPCGWPMSWVTVRPRFLVTGQGAKYRAYVTVTDLAGSPIASADGTVFGTAALVNGAYVAEATDAIRIQLSDTSYKVIRVGLTTADGGAVSTDAASSYPGYVGAALLGCTIAYDAPGAADLNLPGADTIPAAYQPIDDLACGPRSPVVAQDDRIGRRAGPYYLVRNLIWLMANRSAVTLVADWVHRTQHAGYGNNNHGDQKYRNTTVFPFNAQVVGAWQPGPGWFPGTPGWSDRADPANANELDAGASPGGVGHHYPGDALMKLTGRPLSGGKIGGFVRSEVQFVPDSPFPASRLGAQLKLTISGLADPIETLHTVHLADTDQPGPVYEWSRLIGHRGLKFGLTDANLATLRLASQYWETNHWGLQVSVLAAYLYELPLTQADLDALA